MEEKNLERINFFSRLARERALTKEEEAEREMCRQKYREAFRAQMRTRLDNTTVEYPDGTRLSLKESAKRKES